MVLLPSPLPSPRQARLPVLEIQRTCLHDGPGIRTTVFLRGCPLDCRWCHNPEARAFVPASDKAARRTVEDVLAVVDRDRAYFGATGGGLTLSGGEPLAQPLPDLLALLQGARDRGLPVAVETAGDVPWRTFRAVMPFVDLFLFDLKAAGDPGLHRDLTGRDGRRIRDNLLRLARAGAPLRARFCVVPGLNDAPAVLGALAALLAEAGLTSLELLRYHGLHQAKARRLGLDRPPLDIPADRSRAALQAAREALRALGVDARDPATDAAPRPRAAFTPRVLGLKRDIRQAGYAVCIESAELKTDWCRRHGDSPDPLPVRRAALLRHLLAGRTLAVHRGELLVGNYTSKRVAGNVWVEYFGAAAALNLWRIDRQTPVPFRISTDEKRRFYTRVLPFWLSRGLHRQAFPRLPDLAGFLARAAEKAPGFNNNLAGIAHYVMNGRRLLDLGTEGLAAEARAGKAEGRGDPAFFDGVLLSLQALEEFAARYAARLREMAAAEGDPGRAAELAGMAETCDRVPRHPARTLHQALQSLLFLHIALCTESFENAISLGRLDQVLQPYYEADVAAGRLDRDRARELVACFVLKLDEIVFLNDGDSGFQLGKLFESLSPVETVTVGGTDREGRDATNDCTHLILDACELRPIGANMAARVHPGSPPDYLERIAAVYLGGSPMPALYNDVPYVEALQRGHGVPAADARDYAIVGCVEPVASDDHFANTDSANVNVVLPFLQALRGDERRLWHRGDLGTLDRNLPGALGRALRGRADPPGSMDELMERFRGRLQELVRDLLADQQRIEAALARTLPTPLASSLYRGCMARGKDAYDGGTTINSSGIQAVGVTDVADSLAALDALVYRQRKWTMEQVLSALDADFRGPEAEALRQDLLAVPKFGDDGAEGARDWLHRVLDLYVEALGEAPHPSRRGRYVAGYYGLNVNRVYGLKTPALPSGRRAGTPLANSLCPHFGMPLKDMTSALNAVAKVDFARYAPNGTTYTPTLDAGLFPGREGAANLAGLIRGFFQQGGMQFQPNLVSRELLLDAYRNPGTHPDLVVRIAGYCAYFDDLSDDLKREILARSTFDGAGD